MLYFCVASNIRYICWVEISPVSNVYLHQVFFLFSGSSKCYFLKFTKKNWPHWGRALSVHTPDDWSCVLDTTGGALLGPNRAMARPCFLLKNYLLLCIEGSAHQKQWPTRCIVCLLLYSPSFVLWTKASRPGGINGASASSIEEQCHAPARSHELPRERCMCGCGHRPKIHEPASDAEVESTANLLQFPCSCIFFLSLKSQLIW
jgi:hypothetical protein